MSFVERLRQERILAILRAATAKHFVEATLALLEGGVRCLEFTLTTEGALDALEHARTTVPRDAMLGIGSVLDPSDVDPAVDAGADFLVCPNFNTQVVTRASARNVPVIPGALSPTEIEAAWRAGVAAVKVFPVTPVGGPRYITDVRGPLPHVQLVPTGGVGLDDATAHLAAGAIAVGLGGSLAGDLGDGFDRAALRARAERVVAAAGSMP